jgi:hypothetical protein
LGEYNIKCIVLLGIIRTKTIVLEECTLPTGGNFINSITGEYLCNRVILALKKNYCWNHPALSESK